MHMRSRALSAVAIGTLLACHWCNPSCALASAADSTTATVSTVAGNGTQVLRRL